MEVKTKISRVNKKVPTITVEEYDYHDILNIDNAIGTRKISLLETIFRKRLNHITFSVDTHPKSSIIKGMGFKIYFAWISIIIEELFKGNSIQIKNVGVIQLRTKTSTTSYKGFPQDKKRSKNKGFYTTIECIYDKKIRSTRYKRPFWGLGKHYKQRIRDIEDTGYKY